MSLPRTQRYRLTWEFVLKDRGEYLWFWQAINSLLKNFCDLRSHKIQFDHLVVEKVHDAGKEVFYEPK